MICEWGMGNGEWGFFSTILPPSKIFGEWEWLGVNQFLKNLHRKWFFKSLFVGKKSVNGEWGMRMESYRAPRGSETVVSPPSERCHRTHRKFSTAAMERHHWQLETLFLRLWWVWGEELKQ